MDRRSSVKIISVIIFFWGMILVGPAANFEEKKALTFQDIMKFKEIHHPVISEDGLWIAYNAQPDRGDGEVKIHGLKGGEVFTVERGDKPVISKDSRWVVMAAKPKAIDIEKDKKKKPKQGMALLRTTTGEVVHFEKVERFVFSEDSKWLAFQHFREEEEPKKEKKKQPEEESEAPNKAEKDKKKKEVGNTLVLRHLKSEKETQIPFVRSFAFDSPSQYLAYVVAEPEGRENGLYYAALTQKDWPRKAITKAVDGVYSTLSWTKKGSRLAFLSGILDKKNEDPTEFSLWIWDGKTKKAEQAVVSTAMPEEWFIPGKNRVNWTKDGKRIYFGLKTREFSEQKKEQRAEKTGEMEESALFDVKKIVEKRGVDVWHWNDPFIIPHQKKMWPRTKEQTYLAVYHVDTNRFVQLADKQVPFVRSAENPSFLLGLSDVPYRKEFTWYGWLNDVFLISLADGSREKVASRLESGPSLSPNGSYVVYYEDRHWHLFDRKTGETRNLTDQLDIPFFNEDHDYPSNVPGYGVAGWVKEDKAVLIYDKYDIWHFSIKTGKAMNLTAGKGRQNKVKYRVIQIDPERQFFNEEQQLFLFAYHDLKKHTGFSVCRIGNSGVNKLSEENKKYKFLAKAKKSDILIYTKESYQEFPDIWISDLKFSSQQKLSDVNPQVHEFAWGSAELVEWNSLDGIPLQGVLIKPGNYQEGKRYPVIVYFYRFFSQRLHEFNQVVINHRPCFPFYASNGYAVFLPDIRFEVGQPGFSATKCLVPGVQKLIDTGLADPKAVGLHGHSWSGYQTAFVVTQTDIFAAAIAGAPVSNMTSAYSGIRLGSGRARQFQYEKSQSRIGGSLWEYPERYIENSPVFFADRIKTPLLIQFGDKDGAVPWYQGIELYLAMRRLGKDCIFLQYRDEPHHLKKYPNKLDYSIKMIEYFDHYLKGTPAPAWIEKGIPYRGK